jgi:hypothetical protein
LKSSFKKIKEKKQRENDILENESDNSHKKFKDEKDKLEKEKDILKRARDKEKNNNDFRSDNLKKLEDDFNNKLVKINEEKETEKTKRRK